MLNAHPDVAVPPESRFIVELWRGNEQVDVADLLRRLASHKRFQTWDLPIETVRDELDDRERASYVEVIEAAYRAYARVNGKRRWGDKTPRYVEHIDFLARLWPEARFVHLVRDGRNVALSYADVPFGPTTVSTAAKLWASRVRAGMAAGRSLGRRRYIELRYEELVEDAESQAKRLCEFLDLDFDPGMVDHTERARGAVLPRASKYNPRVMQRPLAHLRAWEESMPAEHVELFEAVAGDVLSDLGYERRVPVPGPRARLLAKLATAGLPIGKLRSTNGSEREPPSEGEN